MKEIDTLIDELRRARAEGAEFVLLQVNVPAARAHRSLRSTPGPGERLAWSSRPTFSYHDPNHAGAYVIGGEVAA